MAASARRPKGQRGVIRLLLILVLMLASLSYVVWRQSRTLQVLRTIDDVRTGQAVMEAERAELARRIEQLESRVRLVAAAESRLGMRVPTAAEIVILRLPRPVERPARDDSRVAGVLP